jgi:hypothetical protein
MTPLASPVLSLATFEFPGQNWPASTAAWEGGASREATLVAWGICRVLNGDGGILVGAGLEQGDSLGLPFPNMLHSTCWPFLPCALCSVG